MNNDELPSEELSDAKASPPRRRNSSDPNLTLISVYSPNIASSIQVNVQHSSSSILSPKSTQLFSLFKLPQRTDLDASTINSEPLRPVKGSISNLSSNQAKPMVETTEKPKPEKPNRFLTFVRFLLCRFLPIRSNAIVTPAVIGPPKETNQAVPVVQSKVNRLIFCLNQILYFVGQ